MPSTVIRNFKYDESRRQLHIVFQSGRHYIYRNVPQEIYGAMKASFSKGAFFNAYIRDRFGFVSVGKCRCEMRGCGNQT